MEMKTDLTVNKITVTETLRFGLVWFVLFNDIRSQ